MSDCLYCLGVRASGRCFREETIRESTKKRSEEGKDKLRSWRGSTNGKIRDMWEEEEVARGQIAAGGRELGGWHFCRCSKGSRSLGFHSISFR